MAMSLMWMISIQVFEKPQTLPYQRRMKTQIKTLFASFLLLIAMCFGAFAAVGEKHALGDFAGTQQHVGQNPEAIQLVSLGNFTSSVKSTAECCNAPNRGVCSFAGDTLVLTDGGLLPISNVNTNMSVWSRNPANGDMDWQRVQAQYSNPYDETVSVTMRDVDTGAEQTIVSNRIHPYFVQTARTNNLTGGINQRASQMNRMSERMDRFRGK
jgi:hypothetical protein